MNLNILKLLLTDREMHTKYGKFVKDYIDQTDSKELKLLCSCIDRLYDEYEAESYTVSDLDVMLSKAYPNQPKTLLEPILERLNNESANQALLSSYLEELRLRKGAHAIAVKALRVYETGQGAEALLESMETLNEPAQDDVNEDSEFVTNDITAYLTEMEKEQGLNWRTKTVQDMLGPLRKGDFGFIFARPETGKTSFLASEGSFMLEQLDKLDKILLWVNNEEESHKVHSRVVQATLGITTEQLMHNKERCAELFKARCGDRFKINRGGATSKRDIEQWCKQLNPGLIILDQIDKIQGFDAERYDLKMKTIYQWARELSKVYGPVIGVCQAGGTGDNKRWLTMNDVDSSHTAKQGEADFMLGIGKLHDEQYERVRFLHASKNKLTGVHGKREVLINTALARYEDVQ